jgi:hypothetical protein
MAYLTRDIHGRSSWPSRWMKLWQFEPSETLRDIGTIWLEKNGGHAARVMLSAAFGKANLCWMA